MEPNPVACAGIILRNGPNVLLLRRKEDGLWDFPGGHSEPGETPLENALRETEEETGYAPPTPMRLRQTVNDYCTYTTFIADCPAFAPVLDDEHDLWAWAEFGDWPGPLLPPCAETLTLIAGHERDIAQAMAAGLLDSPYRYENCWLFDLRITGTGHAYRSALDEDVYRPPENYLSDDFISRCNGLAVIFEHPEKVLLDSQEYRERNIGAVIYPYAKGDEVWGIAKIFDDDAALVMQTTHISTSPGVNFINKRGAQKIALEGGGQIVVEGTPSLLDHVAVCVQGVWDKGGDPRGINLGDQNMTEDERLEAEKKAKADAEAEMKAKADAEMPAWAKSIADSVSGLCARMDSYEAKKADADMTEDAKKAKADADEKAKEEEERAKADAEKDTKFADAVKRIDELSRLIPRDLTDEDRNAIAAAQARADSVFSSLSKNLPHAMMGETPINYRRRLAGIIQGLSKEWKGISLKALPDDAFTNAESAIYADAAKAARSPVDIAPYELRRHARESSAGHKIVEYTGDPKSWMEDFMPVTKHVANIRSKGAN